MSELSMITLNLHCLEEENIERNQQIIVDEIIKRDVDIIFLQEVAQYANREVVFGDIKKSNYGYELHQMLSERGHAYEYWYTPIKYSFNKYDEGLAILSKYPMGNISFKYISNTKDYNNWKSRKYLKATIKPFEDYIDLFTVHLGWDSEKEKYLKQCKRMVKEIINPNTIIGGDFNIPCGSEYYDKTVEMGLIDLYGIDESRKFDHTFEYSLDVHDREARIDYIFATKQYNVLEQEIIFKNPMVSDHYGMYMKIEVR